MMPNETNLQLAKQAIERGQLKSNRIAAKQYNISHETLRRRRKGISSRPDSTVHSRLLSDLEEEVLVKHILDLASVGFPPIFDM
jgi:hypothetical protein